MVNIVNHIGSAVPLVYPNYSYAVNKPHSQMPHLQSAPAQDEFVKKPAAQSLQFGGWWFSRKPNPYKEMMKAIERHDLDAFKKVLDSGLDVNKYTGGSTPLMAAASHRQPEMVELLLARKANPELRGHGGQTALMQMFNQFTQPETQRHVQVVEKLAAVSLPNARDKHGETALNLAVHYGFDQSVEVLLRHGADPTIGDRRHGLTPLMYAAWRGEVALTRRIAEAVEPVKRLAFLNQENHYGNNALEIARNNERWDVVQLLRQLGAAEKPDPWAPDEPVADQDDDAPPSEPPSEF